MVIKINGTTHEVKEASISMETDKGEVVFGLLFKGRGIILSGGEPCRVEGVTLADGFTVEPLGKDSILVVRKR